MNNPEAGFRVCMAWLAPTEGGAHHADAADPHDTMRGVTQEEYDTFRDRASLPRQSVFLISDAEVAALYRQDYWLALPCPPLDWPLALCAFDTAVNCGAWNARKLLARTHDPATYISLRGVYYRELAAAKPAKAPNLPGWLNRNRHLAMSCGVTLVPN